MKLLTSFVSLVVLLVVPATAQFQFFEQMFQQGGGQQHQARPQNVGSDSSMYQKHYESAHCDRYLCPHTLACVHYPHHCPCAFPAVEDKIEFADGSMACVSKGGWSDNEAKRKLELARKGFL